MSLFGMFGPPNVDKLTAKGDVPGLIKALAYKKDSTDWSESKVRRAAAEALGDLKDARAVNPLIAAFKDRDSEVRRAAATALGKIGAPAFESLIAACRDSDAEISWAAATALGEIGDDRAVEPLIGKLKDSDEKVRKAAMEALGKLKDARAVEPLIIVLQEGGVFDRQAAAAVLGQLGDRRAIDPLVSILTEHYLSSTDLAKSAAEALTSLGWHPPKNTEGAVYWSLTNKWGKCVEIGDAVIELLVALSKHHDESLREGARETIVKMGHQLRCNRCGKPATKQFGLSPDKELVCDECWSAPGVCSGCGRKFGSDAALIRVGSNKNCPQCNKYYEQEVANRFKFKTTFR